MESSSSSSSSSSSYLCDIIIDCHDLILSCGYIDLQLNGGFGIDFSSPDHITTLNDVGDDGITFVSKNLLKYGITSYLPTVITSSSEAYRAILPHFSPRQGSLTNGATVLGVHVEGPFITVKGAHPEQFLKNSTRLESLNDFINIYGDDSLKYIKMITLAPEIDGILNIIKELTISPYNIIVSIGHSNASINISEQACLNGATMITHLFNAMLPFHHRDPGIVGLIGSYHTNSEKSLQQIKSHFANHSATTLTSSTSASSLSSSATTFDVPPSIRHEVAAQNEQIILSSSSSSSSSFLAPSQILSSSSLSTISTSPSLSTSSSSFSSVFSSSSCSSIPCPSRSSSSPLYYGIIVDRIHTHPASVKIAFESHREGIICVSDAMIALGLQDGIYSFGAQSVTIANKKALVTGTSTLAGSIACLNECVQNLMEFTRCNIVQAIESATLHPAKLMKIEHKKGRLSIGADADLILLDTKLNVQATFINGNMAWMKHNSVTIKYENQKYNKSTTTTTTTTKTQ